MVSRLEVPAFASGERRDVPFDFASDLNSGSTISTADAVSEVWSGTDASPNIVNGTAISGTVITVDISGGTLGVTYLVTVTATASDGEILIMTAYIPFVPGT